MSFLRKTYDFFMAASIAHAKWDYEVSMNIIKNRKNVLILLILLLPILAVSWINAADIIGGKTAYAPAHYSNLIFAVSIAVGLAAGLITGCIGAGGGFIITPALMAAGVKGILAVGTDVFHIFAKAIMGTTVHKKLGNVSVKLAIAFLIGSGGGTFIGGAINKGLYNKDPLLSEAFISTVYATLLGFLGFYALAMGMLIGSLIGIQVGALTTKVVKGIHIRGFYAMSIIAGFINRASTLPKKLTELEYLHLDKSLINNIEFAGNIIFWIVVALFGFWILSKFFVNIGKLREEA
jgi:hypothetical protein